MILGADIGASKVRVGAFRRVNQRFETLAVRRFATAESDGIIPVLKRFLREENLGAPDALAVGIAGPVTGTRVKMTNLPWIIETEAIQKELRCPRVALVNDLVAHGYGTLELSDADYVVLQAGKSRPGNRAFIAAGSGLGECILHWNGKEHLPSASEGGHSTFGPRNALQVRLLKFLMSRHPEHVSWERIVSGHYGFRNAYDFLSEESTSVPRIITDTRQQIGPDLSAAAERGDELARRTLDLFFDCYGAEAGNLSLKAMALNGLYIAGGIARRMLALLKESSFLEAFCAKGRLEPVLREIPIYVVMDKDSPAKGLARCAESLLLAHA